MLGGQHRNDELNGPSRSGERETERSRNSREQSSTKRSCADPRGAQDKQKLRRNVLDGADFVRDVPDTYLEMRHFPIKEFYRRLGRGRLPSAEPPRRSEISEGSTNPGVALGF